MNPNFIYNFNFKRFKQASKKMGKTETSTRRGYIWVILIFFVIVAAVAPAAYKLHWYFVDFCISTVLIIGIAFSPTS
jgi:Flp pilus assembly protein TadB